MRFSQRASALVVCLLTAVAVSLAGDEPFAPYRDFKVGDAGRAVTPGTVQFSHLELDVADGQVFPIVNGTGETIGFQFEGHGTWRYAVKGREALMTYKDNADRVSRAYDVGVGQVRDKFTRATVLYARPVFEALAKPDNAAAPTPQAARDDLQKTLQLMRLGWAAVDHRIAEARLGEAAGQQYVYAEFDGGEASRTGYLYDAMRNGREVLRGFVTIDGLRYTKEIAVETVDGVVERTPWVMEHIDLDVNTPDNKAGTIKSTIRIRTQVPGVRVLSFNLTNHRNRRENSWLSKEEALTVQRIVDDKGRELPFSHRYFEIVVDLGDKQPAGAVRTLTFETAGDIFTAFEGRRGDQFIELFSDHWFPNPSGLRKQGYTFTVSLRTKKPYMPVVSGDTESLTEDGDYWVLKAKSTAPTFDLAAFAGKYEVSEIKNDRWAVRAYAYGLSRKEDRERLARTAAMFIEIFERFLGPYPQKELDIVEIPSMDYFGIAPTGMILLPTRFFSPREFQLEAKATFYSAFFTSRGINGTVAHEVAHQWFGHRAWSLRSEDTWLDESISEYMAGIAISIATKGQDINRAKLQDFQSMMGDWRSWNGMAKTNYSLSATDFSNDDNAFQYRIYMLYSRGPLVLHMLRTLLGDDRFVAVTRQYLEDAKVSGRTTDDFAASASKVLRTDMHWFFDQWFRSAGETRIKVQQRVDSSTGPAVLKATLTQGPSSTFRKIHVPLILTFPDGHREVRLAFQEQPTQEFSFPLPAAPTKVEVDPSHNNLVTYE